MSIKSVLRSNPQMKKLALWVATSENGIRPRWWVRRLVNPFYHKRGKQTIIFSHVRMDLVPYNPFTIGHHSTIEDFAIINNGMGPVHIGNHVFIGASNVIIGPIIIHDHVMSGQHVIMSGLNHGFDDVTIAFRYQPCITSPISVGEATWIGGNVVVTAGVQIGKYCVIAAGSIVTKNVPDYTMVAGNPARPIKTYNQAAKQWEKIESPPAH